jgi:hypothetical protein
MTRLRNQIWGIKSVHNQDQSSIVDQFSLILIFLIVPPLLQVHRVVLVHVM